MLRTAILSFAIIMGFSQGVAQESNPVEPATAAQFYNRGVARNGEKRYDEALSDYSKAIELDPELADVYFSRSALHSEVKKDHLSAVADLAAYLKLRPGDYSALFNRGLYNEQLRDYDKAIADYTAALDENSDFSRNIDSPEQCRASAYHYRGRVYQWHKKDDKNAAADYTEAIRFDPAIEMVHYRRGQVYHNLKMYAEAHADFELALEQKPDYPNLLISWAWQLATCPDEKFRDGPLALKLATKANHFNTMAAAYAEVGQFDEAFKHQRRAIVQLPKGEEELRKAMEHRSAMYENHQPFREE